MSQTELNVHLLPPFSPPSNIYEYLEGMYLLFCKGAIKSWGNGSSKTDTYSNNVDFRKRICSQADPHKNAWLGHWKIIEWMIFFTGCLQVFPQQYKYYSARLKKWVLSVSHRDVRMIFVAENTHAIQVVLIYFRSISTKKNRQV